MHVYHGDNSVSEDHPRDEMIGDINFYCLQIKFCQIMQEVCKCNLIMCIYDTVHKILVVNLLLSRQIILSQMLFRKQYII